MSGTSLHWARPELAPLLWAWGLAVIGLVLLERRRGDALDRLVGPALRDRLVERPSRWRRWARVALLAASTLSMILALMQPQWGLRFVATPRVGAEIMIALDVSRSMLADDARPSRLERAKAEISDLLSYLEDDHVGLIAFAGRATVLSPMTPDKSFLRLALDSAGPHSVARGGTSLAEPIRRAVAGMGEPGPAQRALILITDGEDHDSFALDAAKAAAEAGIKIIAIGFGDESGSRVYVRDPETGARTPLRDADGRPVVSRLNGELLRELALATEGAFVPAGTGVLDLASIYEAHIQRLTRGQLDERGRTIRDEVYALFVIAALLCLVGAVSIAAGRRRPGDRWAPLLVSALILGPGAPAIEAQELVDGDEAAAEAFAPEPAVDRPMPPVDEDPRERFNRANARLVEGDATGATTLYREARRDAPDDLVLRYAATYNLGLAASTRADSLVEESPTEALAALHEAADWFRESAALRPDAEEPRQNLDVTLRRALRLADEIARGEEQGLEERLDALIEAQRERAAQVALLLEDVVRRGELDGAEAMRAAFRDVATEQRLVLSDAAALGDRIAGEREGLMAVPEQERSPEDALRGTQLEAVLGHLDSAIDRMGRSRRALRQRRAERAYRRAAGALSDLKRARDQLRSPVDQIGVLLGEVGRLATATAALAGSRLGEGPRPAFLTPETHELEATRIEARVTELAERLEGAARQAAASAPVGPGDEPPPSGGDDRDALRTALVGAAPRAREAAAALERATVSVGSARWEEALRAESEAAQALADAREQFFELRQLLDAAWADEGRIAALASPEDPELVDVRETLQEPLIRLQEKNLERAGRLEGLLERERAERLAELEASLGSGSGSAVGGSEAEGADGPAQERERFAAAEQLLALASGAMLEVVDALGPAAGGGAADWPAAARAAERAAGHLEALRSLFFSITEHLRELARDQVDLSDRTRNAIALAAPERPPPSGSPDLVDGPGSAGQTDAEDDASAEPSRGPETRERMGALADEQRSLEQRGGALADALLAGSDEAARSDPPDEESAAAGSAETIRRAAEHVARAQLSMGEAAGGLADDGAPLASIEESQTLALEELARALALLSPPPPAPPPEGGDDESEEGGDGQPEPSPEEQTAGAPEMGSDPAGDEADAEMGDASQLLQGVRDREAERRRERDRIARQRRSEPVEKDW